MTELRPNVVFNVDVTLRANEFPDPLHEKIIEIILSYSPDVWREEASAAATEILKLLRDTV